MSDYVITGAVAQYSRTDPAQIPLSLGGMSGTVPYPTPGYFSPTTDNNPAINILVTLTYIGTINFPATISAQATSISAESITWTQIVPPSTVFGPRFCKIVSNGVSNATVSVGFFPIPHGYSNGETISISGTANFDGIWTISNVTLLNFQINTPGVPPIAAIQFGAITSFLEITVTATISPVSQPTDIINQNYLVTVTDSDARTEVFNIGVSNPGGYPAAQVTKITNYPDPSAFASTPGPPTALVATPFSSTQVNLSWNAPANPGSSPITGYQISRESPIGSGFHVIISNTNSLSTSHSDMAVLPGVTYNYQVAARNTTGIGELSNQSFALTPTSVPGAPTSLTASAVANNQIDLSWIAPVITGGTPITGYKIWRESPTGGGFAVLVADTASTAVAYSDLTVAATTQYNYKVDAINGVGTGPDSNQSAATTPA